jgi:hypothetical protein
MHTLFAQLGLLFLGTQQRFVEKLARTIDTTRQ